VSNKPKTTNITKTMLRSSIRPSSPYMGNESTTQEYPVARETEKITQETSSPSQNFSRSLMTFTYYLRKSMGKGYVM